MDEVLVLDQVSRRFGGLWAVRDVSARVPKGTRLGIIGPNGAGKTTLFHLITGHLRPTHGRITFRGHDITTLPPHHRARLGMGRTFQITNLFTKLSVLDNVLLALDGLRPSRFAPVPIPSLERSVQRQAFALLEQVGLAEHARTEVRYLSYGDQRKLEIALALANAPALLLLDEPTAGLGIGELRGVLQVIHGLPRSVTLLLIEHDMDVVFDVVDSILVMHQGQVLAQGPPDVVRNDPRVREVYLAGLEPT